MSETWKETLRSLNIDPETVAAEFNRPLGQGELQEARRQVARRRPSVQVELEDLEIPDQDGEVVLCLRFDPDEMTGEEIRDLKVNDLRLYGLRFRQPSSVETTSEGLRRERLVLAGSPNDSEALSVLRRAPVWKLKGRLNDGREFSVVQEALEKANA